MIREDYSEAISETLDILGHMQESDIDKIPKKFIDFLKENKSKTYKPNLDYTKSIKDMKLKSQTIGILSLINKKYWCNNEERKVFEEKLKQNELRFQEEIKEKYNVNKSFKNKELKKMQNVSITDLTECPRKKWYLKIFEKIKRIFGKNVKSY